MGTGKTDKAESCMDLATAILTDHQDLPKSHLNLCNVPAEIRAAIYEYLLVKNTAVSVAFLGSRTNQQQHNPKYQLITRGKQNGPAVGDKKCTSILRVCKQMHGEAVVVLYDQNHFSTFDIRGFQTTFVHNMRLGIGSTNAARIRQITIGLSDAILNDSGDDLEKFLVLVCEELVALQHLVLRTRPRFLDTFPRSLSINASRKDQRGIMYAAACVRSRHPLLKHAKWLSAHPSRDWMFFCVYLMPMGHKNKMYSGLASDLHQQFSKDMQFDLDCARIQELTWNNLLNHDPEQFKLLGGN